METIQKKSTDKLPVDLFQNGDKILFTSSVYPYPTLPNDTSLTDATGARFTRGDGIFTIISHSHHFANHILAQNIDVPSVILEYPRWKDFVVELKKGYSVVGISALPVHLENVLKMCSYIKENYPHMKIILGCYAGMALEATMGKDEIKSYVDYICHGEGVKYLRELIGEEIDRPILQHLMPKGGGSPQFITKFPSGVMGFLVSGLGCPGNCDFCSSTALYDHRRIQMLTPKKLVEHMYSYHKSFPNVTNVFVIEEDHFRWHDYILGVKETWSEYPDMVEALDWFAFGSMDNIGSFVDKYGWDAIVESGIGVMFIGVESKFGDLLKYKKRSKYDPKEIFKNLHRMGIRTVGSWVCGWDFHTHANIYEDLNYFVALQPTYQQLTRLSPFPGTPLFEQLRKEGRLKNVNWNDIHFWSETQKNLSLEDHETLNLVEYGYELLTNTWGPSMLRRLEVMLDGYNYCKSSSNPIIRDHKSKFYKKQSGLVWALLQSMEKFAPNGIVRRRIKRTNEKYVNTIGNPSAVMTHLSNMITKFASKEYIEYIKNPSFYGPKEEPFKKYHYTKNGHNGKLPYITEWPGRTERKVAKAMRQENFKYFFLEKALKLKRISNRSDSDPDIDKYLIDMVSKRAFGFGL